MTEKLFEAALGITPPWFVAGVDFDAAQRTLTIQVDFVAGSRFAVPQSEGAHPVHDTVVKRYRHLNFFQHECHLEVRTPRVKLPDGGVRLVEPDWAGKLSGFTLLFEALVLLLCREMSFTAVARTVTCRPTGYRPFAGAMSSWRGRKPTTRRCGNWPSTRPRAPAATIT